MSARTDKRRESIVSLTHTEIMLVLAVVILLLLLAKGFALTESQEKLEETERRVALLEQASGDSAEEEEARQEKVDLAEEVTEILVLGGTVKDDGGKERQLGEQPAEDVRALVDEKKRRDKMDEVIDDALARAEESPPDKSEGSSDSSGSRPQDDSGVNSEQQRTEKIIRMSEEVAKTKEEADALRSENEKLKATISVAAAAEKEKSDSARVKSISDEIGFFPCWLGDGNRKYYFTYDIIHYADSDTFRISPHSDWRSGADVVNESLNGLPVIKNYPKGNISHKQLLAFGKRLTKEKNKLHDKRCLFATTINKEVNGTIILFIRNQVRLYPVY